MPPYPHHPTPTPHVLIQFPPLSLSYLSPQLPPAERSLLRPQLPPVDLLRIVAQLRHPLRRGRQVPRRRRQREVLLLQLN